MVRVKEFEEVDFLNKFLIENKITREKLIDIKYISTNNCFYHTYFLLIYEE